MLVTAAKACLRDLDLLTERVEHYIDELLRFIVQAKRDILEADLVFADEFSYDFGEISVQKWTVDPWTLLAGEPRRRAEAAHRRARDDVIIQAQRI